MLCIPVLSFHFSECFLFIESIRRYELFESAIVFRKGSILIINVLFYDYQNLDFDNIYQNLDFDKKIDRF